MAEVEVAVEELGMDFEVAVRPWDREEVDEVECQ